MAQKHMTKKELKEDPFFEEVAHIVDFFRKHQNLLITISIIVLVLVAGFFGSKAIIKQQNEKAGGYFGIAIDYYSKDQLVEAEDQFMLVAEQYKRTDWGKRSYYYLGLIAEGLGRPEEEALEYFETYVNSNLEDPALKASAYQLIGTYYYRNGDLLTAGANYQKAAKKTLAKSEKVNLGIRAGEAFIEAGADKKLDEVVNYLGTLDLNDIDKARVKVLTVLK